MTLSPQRENTDLKPCPFCSSTELSFSQPSPWWVYCSNCFAEGPSAKTRKAAIAAWNTRVNYNQLVSERDRYREALIAANRIRDFVYDCTKDEFGHGWTLSADQTDHVIALAQSATELERLSKANEELREMLEDVLPIAEGLASEVPVDRVAWDKLRKARSVLSGGEG